MTASRLNNDIKSIENKASVDNLKSKTKRPPSEKKQHKKVNTVLFKSKKRKSQDQTGVTIYWERIYRYVENFEKLFGRNVHVCKGELGSQYIVDDEAYRLTPLSQCSSEGALFEMEEIEEDEVLIEPKFHQPGTGVATELNEELVVIKRIFYSPEWIHTDLLKKINALHKEDQSIELTPIDFVDLLSDSTDSVKLARVASIPKRLHKIDM